MEKPTPEAADVAVVGLGYVGLPLVQAACHTGLAVIGYDTDPEKVAALAPGRSYVDEFSDADIAALIERGFQPTTHHEALEAAATVVICVPTPPRADDGAPDLAALRHAAHTVGIHLQPGITVVIESTTYPGTTEELVRPLLEEASGLTAGDDFALAFSPERVDPGNPVYGLANTPKVVGRLAPTCADAAEAFYAKFCDRVVCTAGTREAEMAKLLENTYRHVNIALVNEMLVFCDELGIDLWDAIGAASTKPFGFEAFYPSPGVRGGGGHCYPSTRTTYPSRLSPWAICSASSSWPRRSTPHARLCGHPRPGPTQRARKARQGLAHPPARGDL